MNILWHPLIGIDVIAAERICKKYNVENLYLMRIKRSEGETKGSLLEPLIREYFDYDDMVFARYDKYIWHEDMIPLDKEILDAMAPYEPEALKMLERVDGVATSAEFRFMQYHRHLRYWNNFLEKAHLDLFFCSAPPHAWFDYILMRLCQVKRIAFFCEEYYTAVSAGRMRLVPSYEDIDDEIINKINYYKSLYNRAEEIELPKDIETGFMKFKGSKEQQFSVYVNAPHPFANRVKLFIRYFKENKGYSLKRTCNYFINKIKTRSLIRIYEKLAVKADYNKKYIYFPLHYQPELTTSPLGGWYVHQYLVAEMLSYYVPDDVLIYVREHPCMKLLPHNSRIVEHYKTLKKIKKVVLISMEDDSQKLIDESVAVASITGSVGYEALYKGKPYIMFGNQFMKYGPGTINVRNNEDCRRAMQKIFGNEIHYSDIDIRIMLKVFGEVTTKFHVEAADGTYVFSEEKNKKESNIKKLVNFYSDAIEKNIKLTTGRSNDLGGENA